MGNLDLYLKFAPVPENAKKKISGGKLNGKTDINPIWRIKMLTETFGPVGFGWYTHITDRWVETADGESAAWIKLELFVKDPATGEWSKPIEGTGGSKQNGKGQGDGINDEAFKMAETDAISVACKKLGMGADIYWEADKTKNSRPATPAPAAMAAPAPATAAPAPKKPVITEGNALWPKAIAYCVANNVAAKTLVGSYSIDDATLAKLQDAIDKQKNV